LLYVHGGVVKITAVSEVEARGDVIVPLASAAPAEAGAWRLTRLPPESARQITDQEVAYADHLRETGVVGRDFNWIFFTRGASREAEMAGILGAVVGSVLTLTVTLALSFPLGVAAAVYLENSPRRTAGPTSSRSTSTIWQPCLPLSSDSSDWPVFLNFFGMPRSAPLVGGMVLALITLPYDHHRVARRAESGSAVHSRSGSGGGRVEAADRVPPRPASGSAGRHDGDDYRHGPCLGETAPLLMIGMVAFIVDIPSGFLDSATILPVQIFMWADFPEAAFAQKTSAAIIVLLAFLVVKNAVASAARRFERVVSSGDPRMIARTECVPALGPAGGWITRPGQDSSPRRKAASKPRKGPVRSRPEGLRLLRREAGVFDIDLDIASAG
jgi:phosphate transport system permease protein